MHTPRHLKGRRVVRRVMVMIGAVVLCIGVLTAPYLELEEPMNAAVAVTARPELAVDRIDKPQVTWKPRPTAEVAYQYGEGAPRGEAVGMEYFADAVFIGDSRTDGLRLYSGIKGTSFYCYKGITVFDIMNRPEKRVVTIEGKQYTVLEGLGLKRYGKVYVSLGVNELGYGNNSGFEKTFEAFIDKVQELQPDAEIYLQTLVPVNPEKCKEHEQAEWANNERVREYNEIFRKIAIEKKVILLDVASGLSDSAGNLPAEGTVDGIHFTREYYKKWLRYIMEHTVRKGG